MGSFHIPSSPRGAGYTPGSPIVRVVLVLFVATASVCSEVVSRVFRPRKAATPRPGGVAIPLTSDMIR